MSIGNADMDRPDRGRARNGVRKGDGRDGAVVQRASEGVFARSRVRTRTAGNSECFAAGDAESDVLPGTKRTGRRTFYAGLHSSAHRAGLRPAFIANYRPTLNGVGRMSHELPAARRRV
ncbi:hypothetical protein B0H17DRAFT_1216953 [Mycena rosella]|uniref:Uncharacterized protein n=1 Tax=Mycena rosella TaxID=1033263 RepID=A0AAD7C2Z1_MYCRO|nr:hypothetical protein B0H17DRAFT_1216953 [Mycena rosella]